MAVQGVARETPDAVLKALIREDPFQAVKACRPRRSHRRGTRVAYGKAGASAAVLYSAIWARGPQPH